MTEILMPRLGANDNFVKIAQWLAEDGGYVEKDETVAVLETIKETSDLTSPVSGYLYKISASGNEYGVNKKIACICETADELAKMRSTVSKDALEGYKMTKKAEKIIKENKIDITKFDRDILITEKMLLKLLDDEKEAFTDAESINNAGVNSVIILCGGGLCKMSISAIRSAGGLNIRGILDNKLKKGQDIMSVEVLGDIDELKDLYDSGYRYVVNALGSITATNEDPLFHKRKELYYQAKSFGFSFPNVIHSSAFVDASARLGEGNLIFAKALVDCDSVIGSNAIINTGSIISHDCQIGNHVRISPGAILAGGVVVGENSLIGMGVTVYMNVKIGKNVIISNGKNIFSDIPDNTVVV